MFKKMVLCLVTIIGLSLVPSTSHAAAQSGAAVRYPYSTGHLDGVNWTPLVSSTVKAIKGITVMNTGAYVLELGVGLAGAASAADVRQLIVPATANLPGPVYLPLVASQGVRISIRQMTSSGAVFSGEFQLGILYN